MCGFQIIKLLIIGILLSSFMCRLSAQTTGFNEEDVDTSKIVYSFHQANNYLSEIIDGEPDCDFFIQISNTNRGSSVILLCIYKRTSIINDSKKYIYLLDRTNRFWLSNEGREVPIVFAMESMMAKFPIKDIILGHCYQSVYYNYVRGTMANE